LQPRAPGQGRGNRRAARNRRRRGPAPFRERRDRAAWTSSLGAS
jgi:hypothetical protein